jgi:hypothetical protein
MSSCHLFNDYYFYIGAEDDQKMKKLKTSSQNGLSLEEISADEG